MSFLRQIKVVSAEINKSRFSKGIRVKYRVYRDEEYTETELVTNTLSPKFNHASLFTFPAVTQETLDFFDSGRSQLRW